MRCCTCSAINNHDNFNGDANDRNSAETQSRQYIAVAIEQAAFAQQKFCPCVPAMLHIRMLSGTRVASIPVEELSDVRSLKQTLNLFHGFPPRFRQRLFLRGDPLADAAKLDSPLDLELVLLESRPPVAPCCLFS